MKTYEKPTMEVVNPDTESVLSFGSVYGKEGFNENGFGGGYVKRQNFITEDAECLSNDISFAKDKEQW